MVSYLDRFLQDAIDSLNNKGRNRNKLQAFFASTFTFRWKHAYSLVVRIRYYTKNKNFSGYEVLQGLILSIWRSSSGSVMSLNGSDPRDAYHPGDTGTVQNRTVRRLCRMLLPPRLQQRLPCGPHGPVLCLWHLCMPTPPEI